MSIRRGLRFDDDADYPDKNYEKTGIKLNLCRFRCRSKENQLLKGYG